MDAKSFFGRPTAAPHESADISPAQAVTECLEYERRVRQQMYRFGIPAMMLFFFTELNGASYSAFFVFVAFIALLRFFLLQPTSVDRKIDERVILFNEAVQAFHVQQYVKNNTSGDLVRILSRRRYRRLKWPFPVIILEQRWRKTSGQLFLVIGPSEHWWSGGNIWSQWKWAHRRNADLSFSKRTATTRNQFLLDIRVGEGLVWSLNFKNAANRDQACEALSAIRNIYRPIVDRDTERPKQKPHTVRNNRFDNTAHASNNDRTDCTGNGHGESRVEQKAWYEILGVKADAPVQDIKAAYQNAIKKCHPDTVANRSELIQRAAESETKQINLAYESAKTQRGF